ncbi:unnamed protein product [Lathyrus sativus]|nr:unnamed protein product [Lathyrus sativus]
MVVVDFTASYGNPQQPDSLHYISGSGRLNSCQKAIMEVGDVILFYDSDKRFPAWGFGGMIPGSTVSHCFNLNGNPASSEVVGVEGIMEAYANALHTGSFLQPKDDPDSEISKVVRAIRKKLQQIKMLETKQSKGHILTARVKIFL